MASSAGVWRLRRLRASTLAAVAAAGRKRGLHNPAGTAFGQGQAGLCTPAIALVAARIANQGESMQPHVVAGRRSRDGEWMRKNRPGVLSCTRLSD